VSTTYPQWVQVASTWVQGSSPVVQGAPQQVYLYLPFAGYSAIQDRNSVYWALAQDAADATTLAAAYTGPTSALPIRCAVALGNCPFVNLGGGVPGTGLNTTTLIAEPTGAPAPPAIVTTYNGGGFPAWITPHKTWILNVQQLPQSYAANPAALRFRQPWYAFCAAPFSGSRCNVDVFGNVTVLCLNATDLALAGAPYTGAQTWTPGNASTGQLEVGVWW
jgi:hypothetical protein